MNFSPDTLAWPKFPGDLVVRALAVYFAVLLLFRLFGKKEGKEISPTSMVFLLLMSDALQNSMIGDDKTLIGGIIVVVTFLILNFFIDQVKMRSKKFESMIEGEPRILLYQGKVLRRALHRERLTEKDLLENLRKNGLSEFTEAKLAVLETNGEISILKAD